MLEFKMLPDGFPVYSILPPKIRKCVANVLVEAIQEVIIF